MVFERHLDVITKNLALISNNNLEKILWKYFKGTASVSEIKSINPWLDEDRKNVQFFATSKEAYIEIIANIGKNSDLVDRAYDKFLKQAKQISEAEKKNVRQRIAHLRYNMLRYSAAAAILVITVLSTYFIINYTQPAADDTYCEISVPYGGRSSLVLPDGSEIWLNAGSKFSYNRNFDIKSREVYLDGEAYFDVEKSRHPFVVHTSHLDIMVLGTSFNVKSYSEDEKIETTLVEGSIRIERKESDKPLYLKPKQKLTYNKRSSQYQTDQAISESAIQEEDKAYEVIQKTSPKLIAIEANVNTEEATSWKDGKLIINNEPLEELIKKLERKYDIIFRFDSQELKKYSYSGTLGDFPLEQVLKALELTSPIKYSIEEKTAFLYYNKNFNPLTNSN